MDMILPGKIKPEIYAGLSGSGLSKELHKKIDQVEKNKRIFLLVKSMLGKLEYKGDLQSLIDSDSRRREEVILKQLLYYRLYHKYKFNYLELGEFFKRNHATIIYGVKTIRDSLDIKNKQIINLLNKLKDE